MSKLLLFCTVMCLLVLCWSKSIQLEDRPGYCTYEGIYIKEGEHSPSPLGTCNRVHCIDGKAGAIGAVTCSEFYPSPGCSVGDHDYTKLYPDCCPGEVC